MSMLRLVSDAREEVGDGLIEDGVDGAWGDLGEGLENEPSFVKPGVGDGEGVFGDDLVGVEDEVEVDGAWAPAEGGIAAASHVALDGEEGVEEGPCGEGGFEGDGGVEVGGLGVGAADGVGFDEGGARNDAGVVEGVDAGDRVFDECAAIAKV